MTLSALQLAVVASLAADPWIIEHEATILAEDQGDVVTAVDEAISRAGIVAVIVTPEFSVTSHDGAVIVGRASIRVAIYEEPALNRLRANACTALQLGEHILTLVRDWPGFTPESLRQSTDADSGIMVDVAIAVPIIHDATPQNKE